MADKRYCVHCNRKQHTNHMRHSPARHGWLCERCEENENSVAAACTIVVLMVCVALLFAVNL